MQLIALLLAWVICRIQSISIILRKIEADWIYTGFTGRLSNLRLCNRLRLFGIAQQLC